MLENELRKKFLRAGSDVIELMIKQLDGEYGFQMESNQRQMVDLIWPLLSDVIKNSKSITPLDLRKKSTGEKLDTLFELVSKGEITFDEAKQYMALISQGFEMTDLILLNEKLDRLENG